MRNGKLHKTFPFRGRQSCEAKTERLLYFHFFLCPVLQGFQHTVLVQQLFACQIGHRAGHPQDTVMGAGGKAQSVVEARSSRSAAGVMRQTRRTCPAVSWALQSTPSKPGAA